MDCITDAKHEGHKFKKPGEAFESFREEFKKLLGGKNKMISGFKEEL